MTTSKSALGKIKRRMLRNKIDGFIVSDRSSVRYLSGFSGSSGFLFLCRGGDYLFTDFRYFEQAEKEAPDCLIDCSRKEAVEKLKAVMLKNRVRTAAFESESVTYGFYRRLAADLNPVRLEPVSRWVLKLRAVKTPEEIRKIRASCAASDRAMARLKGFIRPGVRERDLEAELFYYIKKTEGAGFSFPPVIISGERTSLPHGRPSARKIRAGDMVLVDFGVRLDGYCSDLTRTFCVGRMSADRKHLYNAVLSNQAACIEMLRPGGVSGKAFNFSASGLRSGGYELQHGLGHGVGLEIHELPSISRGSGTRLKENMVFTVEPGAYLKGRFGVRIEDMVLMKSGGVEVLSKTPRRRNEI